MLSLDGGSIDAKNTAAVSPDPEQHWLWQSVGRFRRSLDQLLGSSAATNLKQADGEEAPQLSKRVVRSVNSEHRHKKAHLKIAKQLAKAKRTNGGLSKGKGRKAARTDAATERQRRLHQKRDAGGEDDEEYEDEEGGSGDADVDNEIGGGDAIGVPLQGGHDDQTPTEVSSSRDQHVDEEPDRLCKYQSVRVMLECGNCFTFISL